MVDAIQRPEVAERLRVLRESYARQLKEKFVELMRLAERLRAEVNESDLRVLHLWLHTQAGSAGTFGFPALGSASRAFELELKQRLDSQQLQDESWRREFSRRLLTLESLLEYNLPEATPTIPVATPATPGATPTTPGATPTTPETTPTVASVVTPQNATPPAGTQMSKTTPRLHLHPPSVWILTTDLREAEYLISVLGEFGFLVQHFQGLPQVDCALECEMPLIMIVDLDNMGMSASGENPLEILCAWRRRCPEQLQLLCISEQQDFNTLMTLTSLSASGYLNKPFDLPHLMDTVEKFLPAEREQPYRVLLIDDDQLLSRYYQGALEAAGLNVCVLDSPHTVLDAMSDFRPDVVLLDLNMPEFSGVQVARMLRLHNGWPEVPVIYFSVEQDPDRQIEAQEEVGDDFLTKPVAARQLVSAITVRARRSRMLTKIMSTDSLTSLLKHSAIKDRLKVECRRAERTGAPLCIAMLDVDNFKPINDTWGHATGDRVIKALAHLLRNRLRTTDVVGRYGGDEFMIVFPDSKSTDVLGVLAEITDRFRHIQFEQGNTKFTCTLSIGVADNKHCSNADFLIEAADKILLEVKRQGRNAVKLAEGSGSYEEKLGGH